MSYNGLFTMMDPGNKVFQNKSYPYYGDATWGYGLRTQVTGTMTFVTSNGSGSGTVDPFGFANNGNAVASGVEFQSLASPTDPTNQLVLGALTFSWGGSDISTQIVLDASGMFAALQTGALVPGGTIDQASCGAGGALDGFCATPATTTDVSKGKFPIGASPIATSSFNTNGQTGFGTTIGQLSLGSDDMIGGSPMDNGPFLGFNANFDITSLTLNSVTPEVPVPAAVWLFGSGLIGLVGVARRRKQA
jgi:hypothetical protein